jgi:hypothetical protein
VPAGTPVTIALTELHTTHYLSTSIGLATTTQSPSPAGAVQTAVAGAMVGAAAVGVAALML